jgi:hypothetical protein
MPSEYSVVTASPLKHVPSVSHHAQLFLPHEPQSVYSLQLRGHPARDEISHAWPVFATHRAETPLQAHVGSVTQSEHESFRAQRPQGTVVKGIAELLTGLVHGVLVDEQRSVEGQKLQDELEVQALHMKSCCGGAAIVSHVGADVQIVEFSILVTFLRPNVATASAVLMHVLFAQEQGELLRQVERSANSEQKLPGMLYTNESASATPAKPPSTNNRATGVVDCDDPVALLLLPPLLPALGRTGKTNPECAVRRTGVFGRRAGKLIQERHGRWSTRRSALWQLSLMLCSNGLPPKTYM